MYRYLLAPNLSRPISFIIGALSLLFILSLAIVNSPYRVERVISSPDVILLRLGVAALAAGFAATVLPRKWATRLTCVLAGSGAGLLLLQSWA